MPIEVDSVCVWGWPRAEGKGASPSDGPLATALGVAESVAKRYGGEVQLRSCGDGGVLVELCIPIPAPAA